MNVSDFDFDLPDELIAQEPPAERGQSRLLVLRRASGEITHARFADLPAHLNRGDLLVVNDTRVFPARLLGHRVPSGGAVQCLLIGQVIRPKAQVVSEHDERWEALVHPGQKLKPGARVVFEGEDARLHGEILDRHFHGRRTVRLWTEDGTGVRTVIDRIGHMPLPPYIRRDDRRSDRDRYQTVYARDRGSIAAPTAGLHFTADLFAAFEARGVERAALTLHIGYGTFKPVRVEEVEAHTVDPESFVVGETAAAAITRARREGRRVIAVGTTTTRALESMPVREDGTVAAASGETSLFIHPGHAFRLVDGMVTNFHLPRSSLLMLVAAFGGRDHVLRAYRETVANGYRFYSYGDAMLIV